MTIILLCAVLSCSAFAGQSAARKPFVDYWTAVRVGSVQTGCMHTTIAWDVLDGAKYMRASEHLLLRAHNEGDNLRIDMEHTVFAGKDFSPVIERMCVSANSSQSNSTEKLETTEFSGELSFGPDSVTAVVTTDGKKDEQRFPLPVKPNYARYFGARKLAIGDDVQLPAFAMHSPGPFTEMKFGLSLGQAYRVARREKVTVSGKVYDAYVLTRQGDSSTMWVTEDCTLVKTDDPASGCGLGRQSQEDALKWLETNGPELSRVQVDKPIDNSRGLRDLKVRLVGLYDKSLVLSDSRQKAVYLPDRRAAEYAITTRSFDPSRSVKLPVQRADFRRWLAASPGIEVKDASIRDLAKQIVGSETNAYKAACKLRAWVHDNVAYAMDARQSPDSATLILNAKKGVCTHYAILYAALARAVGIPTKLVVGLCYGNWDGYGYFQFHAWAESYVGDWIAVEPTWGDEVVDATHIKMLEGGVETISDYYRAVGRLSAEVIAPVLSPTAGRAHVILASSDILMFRRPGKEPEWVCEAGETPATAPAVTPGSIVITVAAAGEQWIVPPGYKMDSPDIPNLDSLRSRNPDAITVVMPSGNILVLPLWTMMEIIGDGPAH